MKTTKIFCLFILFLISGATAISAQSGRKESEPVPTPSINVLPDATVKPKSDNQNLEKVRFLISKNLVRFETQLNELGKLGYRVDKAFNYGGDAEDSQTFAAVLKPDDGNTYEYAWMSSPNKNYLESRLNYFAGNGFYVVQTFGITGCKNNDLAQIDKDPSAPLDSPVLRMAKGDVFLFEKKNKSAKKVRDYKVFTGKIGLGKNPSAEIQDALNEVPDEYQPFKILFNRGGLTDFSVSVLLEDDLEKKVSRNTEYKFIKEINGFEKEVNSLAQTGFRFLSGRRVGMIKYALMAKLSGEAASYIFIDQDKYERELPKTYQPGDVFYGTFSGDADCDATETTGAKLVFAQGKNTDSKIPEYKYFHLTSGNKVEPTDAALAAVRKFLADGYQLKDVFFSDGVVIVFAK